MKREKVKARRTVMVRIDSGLKRRMKVEAAKRGISMVEFSRAALEAYLSKPGA